MKKRILLPTDFSKNAQNAIDYAIDLYKNDTCKFYILNAYVVDTFMMELNAIHEIEEVKQDSQKGLANCLKKISTDGQSKTHQFHMVSECGSLIDTIKTIIDQRDIDIIIMGTKGDTDSSAQIYGSQTVTVMEKIRNCPVLAIPAKAKYKPIKEIVFPTGYRTAYKRKEFQYLVDISKTTGASIRVLHVLEKDTQLDLEQLNNKNLLNDCLESTDYTFHTLQDIEIQSALNAFIQDRKIDMVAFINKKHSFFTWLLSKPMAKSLTYHSRIPILALHDLSYN